MKPSLLFLILIFQCLPFEGQGCAKYLRDAALPSRLQEVLDFQGYDPGLNCYNAALLAHYPNLPKRYVCETELRYFLKRDFQIVAEVMQVGGHFETNQLEAGDVLDFDNHDHTGYYLGAGMVFDRRGYSSHYRYRTIGIDETHTGISPRPGSGIEAYTSHREADNFRLLQVFRFRGSNRRQLSEAPLSPETQGYLGLVREVLPWLREATHQSTRGVLNEAVESTVRRIYFEVSEILESPASNLLGDDQMETLLEFMSLYEGYTYQTVEMHFSSPHASKAKFRRDFAATLVPSLSHPKCRLLANAVVKAFSSEKEGLAEAIIAEAAELYYQHQSTDLVKILERRSPSPPSNK